MSHFAVITLPLYSHMHAMEALAKHLIVRGHRVTFFQQEEARTLLTEPQAHFIAVGDPTPFAMQEPGFFHLISGMASVTDMLCRELPLAFRQHNIDAVIVDQMEPAGGLVAQALNLPFISVCCALPVNRDNTIPLPVMPFRYGTSERYRQLYASSADVYDWLMSRQGRVITRHARAFGLPPRSRPDQCLSPLAQISQTIPGFDFPRTLPACFHAVGPLRYEPPTISSGKKKPFVFASLGTIQGYRYGLFRKIARACRQAGVPLLIAHCDGLNASQTARLARAGTQIVGFADQLAVLRDASAVITHAGLNTVMDAIATATPILAVPLAFDQPGVAARVVFSGIGLKACRFSPSRTLSQHLLDLLENKQYTQRITALQTQLINAGGAARAAEIIEQAVCTRRSVPTM